MKTERVFTKNVGQHIGKSITVTGFAQEVRDLKNIKFIVLRDVTGFVQTIALKKVTEPASFEAIPKITAESVVSLTGDVVANKEAKQGYEIQIKTVEVLNTAEPLPMDISDKTNTSFDTRLDNRFLDFHKPKIQAIFKIQNEVTNAFREHWYNKGYLEMQPPCVISAASEGGTELFAVQYFEKKAYLAQSPQLYKQMLACSMEKTFTITPVWRAEKHNTTRHINEIRQMDIEVAFVDQMGVMKLHEECVIHMVQKVKEKCAAELELLGVKLHVPKGVYLSYEEAKEAVKGKVGEDFSPEEEKMLCDMHPGDIVYTHSWPASLKPFYIMPKDAKADSQVSEGFDALYGGLEITSGGQRIHLPELLIERIKHKGLHPENFKSYIDSFRYGAPPHSGWSIGLERFTQILCGLDNVKEATMFPRDRDRLTP
ncbi:MAG: aspartate--tRNA(Asn) ligase [Candidatus Woesearchaeota archaeon]